VNLVPSRYLCVQIITARQIRLKHMVFTCIAEKEVEKLVMWHVEVIDSSERFSMFEVLHKIYVG